MKPGRFILSIWLFSLLINACASADGLPTATTETAQPAATVTSAPAITPTPDKPVGTKKQSASDGMVQLYVPAGEFSMGTQTDGDWVGEDEFPQHEVFLSSFWMDETEVTNTQYQLCVQADTCTPPHALASETHKNYFDNPDFADYPVIQVDWDQAKNYCQWAGRRLPSEAEWEKAARGTDGRIFPWQGDVYGTDLANFDIFNDWPNADTSQVGSIPHGASPYGMMDMAGNVYEWTTDWFSADYYKYSPAENPTGPDQGTARVIRGGAWSSEWVFLRSPARLSYYPDGFSNDIGFRCAQSN